MQEYPDKVIRRILTVNPTSATVMYRNVGNGSRLIEYKEDLTAIEHRSPEQKKSEENLKNNQHFGELSRKAYRRIRRSIEWLEFISTSKYSSKGIEYKVSMITLTIPAFSHEVEEKRLKKVLNQFLTYARLNYRLVSYVWKAELTKQGNLHYHLLTGDIFGSADVQNKWNELLLKEGLLDVYSGKFNGMSEADYITYRRMQDEKFNNKVPNALEKYLKAYRYGCLTNWQNPKSVQIDQIPVSDSIAGYVAKYLSKNVKDDAVDNEALKVLKGRIWGCSRNLSMSNKLSFHIDPNSAAEATMLQDLINVSKSYEDIIFKDKLGLEKVVGYRLSYSSDIWRGHLDKSKLQKHFNEFVATMIEGYMYESYQKKQEEQVRAMAFNSLPHMEERKLNRPYKTTTQYILF